MRKVICSCGSGSFEKVIALFDMQNEKTLTVLEKAHAYKCVQCNEIWEESEIEQIIISDPNTKYIKLYRLHD